MKNLIAVSAMLGMLCGASGSFAQSARDYIDIVGSSTVYPFTTVVAEQFARRTGFKAPKVEATGTGGGFKLFCNGIGVQYPDIANASRAIKRSEYDNCQKNGVHGIIEVKIGYDGIAIAHARHASPIALSLKELFLALAKRIPDPQNEARLIDNPYRTWNEIAPRLPANRIEVLGPPPTSGTRDAFVELAMEGGCKKFPYFVKLKAENEKAFHSQCHAIREDGAYVEAGENDNLIVQKLIANPKAYGIFGFSFLDQNVDKITGIAIDGVVPDFDTIASGTYPVSRPLYFYVKKAHVLVIPGMRQFLEEYSSEKAWGEEGYLTDKGIVPMPAEERQRYVDAIKNLTEFHF